MAKVRVEIKGLKELQLQLKNLPKKLAKEVDAELGLGVGKMVALAKKDAPVDQNTIHSSIGGVQKKELLWEYFSNAAHSVYMEFGTKGRYNPIPGVDPSEFNVSGIKSGVGFYDSILDWVKRKKITGTYNVQTRRRIGSKTDQQIEDEQTAFAIYLSIIRHGVKPHPYFFKQVDAVKPELLRNIENVVNGQRLE